MIEKKITPRSQNPRPVFRHEVKFDGDPTKIYSCSVVRSNLDAPKFIEFRTDVTGQNWIVMEYDERCNNVEMFIQFHTQSEVVEENKVKFIAWFAGLFPWFNFIFRIFSLKTLKFVTKAIAVGFAIPIAFGLVYAVTEYTYESVYDENFDDSAIVEYWSSFTIPAIGKYFREDAIDDAEDVKEFMMEKASDVIEEIKD